MYGVYILQLYVVLQQEPFGKSFQADKETFYFLFQQKQKWLAQW